MQPSNLQGTPGGPEEALEKLAHCANTATSSDLQRMAIMALSAFQQCFSVDSSPIPNAIFVNLLSVLGAADCWAVALKMYSIVPVVVAPLPPPSPLPRIPPLYIVTDSYRQILTSNQLDSGTS
jgi:hypothetical protein